MQMPHLKKLKIDYRCFLSQQNLKIWERFLETSKTLPKFVLICKERLKKSVQFEKGFTGHGFHSRPKKIKESFSL